MDHRRRDPYFECGQSEICNFHCDDYKCAENSIINASESSNLFVFVGEKEEYPADQCLKSANMYAPNHGSATLNSGRSSNQGFYQMSVHSGTNTKKIIINAESSANQYLYGMTVNA